MQSASHASLPRCDPCGQLPRRWRRVGKGLILNRWGEQGAVVLRLGGGGEGEGMGAWGRDDKGSYFITT